MAKKLMTTLASVAAFGLMLPSSAAAGDDPVEFPEGAKHIPANGSEVLRLTWAADGTPKLDARDHDSNAINPNNYVFDLPSMPSDKAKDKSGDINILTLPRADNKLDISWVGKTGEKYPAAMFYNGNDKNVTSTFDEPPENIDPNDVILKLEEVQGPSWVEVFQYRPSFAYTKRMFSSWHPYFQNYNFKDKFDMQPNFVFGKPGDYQISFSVLAFDKSSKEFKSNTITQNWHVTAGAPAKPKPEPEPTPTNTPAPTDTSSAEPSSPATSENPKTPDPEPSESTKAPSSTPTPTGSSKSSDAPKNPNVPSSNAPSNSAPPASSNSTSSAQAPHAPKTGSSDDSTSSTTSDAPSADSPNGSSDDVWPSAGPDAALPPAGGDSGGDSGPGNAGDSSSSGSNGGIYDTPAYVEEIGSSNSGTVGSANGSTAPGGDSGTSASNVSDGGSPGLSVSSVPVDDGTTSEIPASDISGGDSGDSANIAPDVDGTPDSGDSGDLGVDNGEGKQANGGSNSNVTAYHAKKGKVPAKIAGVSSWAVGAAIVMLTGASALAGLVFARRRDGQAAPAGSALTGAGTGPSDDVRDSTPSHYDDVNFRKES